MKFMFPYQGSKRQMVEGLIKRARYNLTSESSMHLRHRSHVELTPDVAFDDKLAKPRGNKMASGEYASFGYLGDFATMPRSVLEAVGNYRSILEHYIGGKVVIRQPSIYRTHHFARGPKGEEVFSEFWHQDTVGCLFNAQLIVLLQDVGEEHGPFYYVADQQQRLFTENPTLVRRQQDLDSPMVTKFIGKRGDSLLLSTGYTLHRAGIPAPGQSRDMMSIAFYPYGFIDDGITFDQLLALPGNG